MSSNWVCIYSSNYVYKVEITQAILAEENIESVVVNKQDSNYLIGEIELHVHPDNALAAKQIINKEEL